jgi:hypothetical protein
VGCGKRGVEMHQGPKQESANQQCHRVTGLHRIGM